MSSPHYDPEREDRFDAYDQALVSRSSGAQLVTTDQGQWNQPSVPASLSYRERQMLAFNIQMQVLDMELKHQLKLLEGRRAEERVMHRLNRLLAFHAHTMKLAVGADPYVLRLLKESMETLVRQTSVML